MLRMAVTELVNSSSLQETSTVTNYVIVVLIVTSSTLVLLKRSQVHLCWRHLLHNTSWNLCRARMNSDIGQRLAFDPEPVYLGVTLDRTLSLRHTCKRLLPNSRTETTCQNSPAQLGAHRPAHSAHQLWRCITQSLNTVVLFGRDPATSVLWTPNSTTLPVCL